MPSGLGLWPTANSRMIGVTWPLSMIPIIPEFWAIDIFISSFFPMFCFSFTAKLTQLQPTGHTSFRPRGLIVWRPCFSSLLGALCFVARRSVERDSSILLNFLLGKNFPILLDRMLGYDAGFHTFFRHKDKGNFCLGCHLLEPFLMIVDEEHS